MAKYVFEWGQYPNFTKEDYNREYPDDNAAIEAAKSEGVDHVWTCREMPLPGFQGTELQNPTTVYNKPKS